MRRTGRSAAGRWRTIVADHGGSRWVDDAKMALACGVAEFESDVPGAIRLLDQVIVDYPKGRTVIIGCPKGFGCEFDRTWVMAQGGLVFLNDDGTVRHAKPFGDTNGKIGETEKEFLAYLGHLKRHPRKTAVVARLLQAEILFHAGQEERSASVLDRIIVDARPTIAQTAAADRSAAQGRYGWLICGLWRPEYQAWRMRAGFSGEDRHEEVDRSAGRTGGPGEPGRLALAAQQAGGQSGASLWSRGGRGQAVPTGRERAKG